MEINKRTLLNLSLAEALERRAFSLCLDIERVREREREIWREREMEGKFCKEKWCGIGDPCVFVCERKLEF